MVAHKQALRDFQSRLSQRLQTAQADNTGASWLAVEAGGVNLLFPLSHAGEIFPWMPVQRVPYTQNWYLGISNLRGALSGVVDLGMFLGS